MNTGFARSGVANDRLPRNRPLARDTAYDFWLSVGPPERGSIEERARELLPDQRLEAGARFEVIVQPYPGELEIDEAARVGELLLDADGQFSVGRQPIAPAEVPGPPDAGSKPERRLRFPIRTPATFGPIDCAAASISGTPSFSHAS